MKTTDTKHGRIISHVDLSVEAIEAIDRYMEAAVEMHRIELSVIPLIPDGCWFQLYGNGNCVVVRNELKDELEDEEE